jgi:hypothetical protein
MAMLWVWTTNPEMGRKKMAMEAGKEFSWQDMPL